MWNSFVCSACAFVHTLVFRVVPRVMNKAAGMRGQKVTTSPRVVTPLDKLIVVSSKGGNVAASNGNSVDMPPQAFNTGDQKQLVTTQEYLNAAIGQSCRVLDPATLASKSSQCSCCVNMLGQ